MTGSDRLSIVAPLQPEGPWRRALAVDRGGGSSQKIVLSFVPPAVLDDPERLAALLRDVEAAGRLHHPGAVPVLGTETVDDQLVIVEPFRPAASVRALLDAAGRLPPEISVRIVVDACAAVARAHAIDAGEGRVLVHGGITPSRVLVSDDGIALVSGFGAGGGGSPDTDVRALAAVLFECLAGEPPRDPAALMHVPGVPAPLAEAVIRALSPLGPTSVAGFAQAIGAAGPLASHADVATYAVVAGPEREGDGADIAPDRGPEEIGEELIVESAEPAVAAAPMAAQAAPAKPRPASAAPVQPAEPAAAPQAVAPSAAPAAAAAPVTQLQPTAPAPAPVAYAQPVAPAPAPVAHAEPTAPAPAPLTQAQPTAPAPAPVAYAQPVAPAPAPVAYAQPAAPAPAPVAYVQPMTPGAALPQPVSGPLVESPYQPLPRPPATRPGVDPAGVFAAPAPRAPRSRLPLVVGVVCLVAGFAGGYAAARAGLTIRFSEGTDRGASAMAPSVAPVAAVAAPPTAPVPDAAAPEQKPAPAPEPRPARETAAPRPAKASAKPAAAGASGPKGILDVTAPPGAEVVLDRRRVGVGSVKVEIPVGRHHVEVRLGGAKVEEAFYVGPGETWTYSVTPTN